MVEGKSFWFVISICCASLCAVPAHAKSHAKKTQKESVVDKQAVACPPEVAAQAPGATVCQAGDKPVQQAADSPAVFKQEAKSIIPHLMQVLAQKRVESALLAERQGPLMAKIQESKPNLFKKTETLLRRLPLTTLQLVAKSTIQDAALIKFINQYNNQLRVLNFILDPQVVSGEQGDLTLTMFYQQHEAKVAVADRATFRERLVQINGDLLSELTACNGDDAKMTKVLKTICKASDQKSLEGSLKKQLKSATIFV
jgi:hypothetical protein